MARRVGIYPGTFDPIHLGHIAFAKEAMRVCKLDEVVFLPEQTPRGKSNVTDILHRVVLINLATKNEPNLRAVQLKSEQFTIAQSLPELQKIHNDNRFTFLIGSDVARSLHLWERIDTLLPVVSFAIGMRSADTLDEVSARMDRLVSNYTLIYTAVAHITSTNIRNGSRDVSLLPPDVLAYIRNHQVYLLGN